MKEKPWLLRSEQLKTSAISRQAKDTEQRKMIKCEPPGVVTAA